MYLVLNFLSQFWGSLHGEHSHPLQDRGHRGDLNRDLSHAPARVSIASDGVYMPAFCARWPDGSFSIVDAEDETDELIQLDLAHTR